MSPGPGAAWGPSGAGTHVLAWPSLCGLCPDAPFPEGPADVGLGLPHQMASSRLTGLSRRVSRQG